MKTILFLVLSLCLFLVSIASQLVQSPPADELALLRNQPEYCKRPWPQLEFFLPLMIHANDVKSRNMEAIAFFLTSYFVFFPIGLANTSVVMVADEEVKQTKEFAEFEEALSSHIRSLRLPVEPIVRIVFNNPSTYYRTGYDRQQLIKLYADNFTTAEYVGIVDTDCVFMTYVDREDLFENGKPVVNGRIGWYGYTLPRGRNHFNPNYRWPNATLALTGHKEPIRCMSYFPIIFKTEHIRLFREFVSRRHGGRSFNEIFRDFVTEHPNYSEVNLVCTYVWYYHRDEYTWYAFDTTPQWDGVSNPTPVLGHEGNRSIFDPAMLLPKPRVALHARYYSFSVEERKTDIYRNRFYFLMFLQRGVCDSPPFPKHNLAVRKYCDRWPKNETFLTIYEQTHRFEDIEQNLNENKTIILAAHRQRFDRIKNCEHYFNFDDYNLADMKEKVA